MGTDMITNVECANITSITLKEQQRLKYHARCNLYAHETFYVSFVVGNFLV